MPAGGIWNLRTMDKVTFITGASSGIGAATARALVRAGARVALFARSADKLDALAHDLGPNALALAGDVTESSDIERAVAEAIVQFGRIDVVFANAGVFAFDDMVNGDPDEWARMVDINVNGVLRTVRAALPGMVERGSGQVVITSSIAGRASYATSSVYAGTKHFLYGWAVALRKQVAPLGIGVSIISPGMVYNELWGEKPGSEEQKVQVEAQTGLTSEDIAEAVVYLIGKPAHVNVADMLVLATRQEVPDY